MFLCLSGVSLNSCAPKVGDTILIGDTNSAKAGKFAQDIQHVKIFIPSEDMKSWIPVYKDVKIGDTLLSQ